mmetsp:Transcript_45614/g.106418  ORF Transcript_45614/g.106418 Transcript_45614/m.106418 type:complete len:86 (+) Transcript_45614:287-544(+)
MGPEKHADMQDPPLPALLSDASWHMSASRERGASSRCVRAKARGGSSEEHTAKRGQQARRAASSEPRGRNQWTAASRASHSVSGK